MTIQLLLFGVVRETAGQTVIELQPKDNTVSALKEALFERFPELRRLKSLLIAINQNYADESTRFSESDEIAAIPPVSGG